MQTKKLYCKSNKGPKVLRRNKGLKHTDGVLDFIGKCGRLRSLKPSGALRPPTAC